MSADRIPPSNLEAEMAALGSVLVDRSTLDIVAGIARPADFYAFVHETIFRAMLDLATANKPLDKIAIAEELRGRGQLEAAGGMPYLTALMDTVPTAASAEYYAQIVREKAQLRGLIHAGAEITKLGFEGETDVDRAISDASAALQRLTDRAGAASGGTPLHVALRRSFDALSERVHGTAPIAAQLTPWAGINSAIGGFYPGEMIIWPSAPKMGKTAALTMLADYVAAHHGAVAIFALEMGVEATTSRLVALHSGISARAQRLGELTDDDLERVAIAQESIAARPITLFDLSCSTIAGMRRELRALSQRRPIAAVIVDHVNFIADVDGARGDRTTKHERLDRVYRELLRIAKEFGCVMHAVQHVTREGMRGRPTLADIRDGGNPEGHAHAVIFPYRPNPTGTSEQRREGEFIIAAAREGEAGIVPMRFVGYRGLWLDRDAAEPWFERSPEPELDIEANQLFGVA